MNQIEMLHISSLDELERQDSIEILDVRRGEISESFEDLLPLDEFNRSWEEVTLDDDIVAESLRFDELAVYWQTRPPLPEFFGEYRLPQPYEILVQDPQETDNLPGRSQKDFVGQLRYIDHAYRSTSGSVTYLRMAPNTSPLEIWHHDLVMTGGDPYPYGFVQLDLTYRQYIEMLLTTKGVRGWQYLFSDVPFRNSPIEHLGDNVRFMLEKFPEIFPDHDYTDLQRRWEARR
ncbi:hypothetical protein RB199_20965 [Streptomyces libani]|uniref:Uncharacterized protein n=1 Tax=Streptomyces nigrescens TaxID=1920 RepID=A0A640TJH8_STRNI|nr:MULTISPECIES: hypothetical protein [Streptomyces]WAT97150.1 hypothetical protein STRLI_003051 [Streptomyces libani subsp. libani]WDT57103.1 hypothetical protein NUT86_25345 [Streptomyces sp. G7(2002)]GFE22601.1 hypothetical protein Sliba_30540 [Streptomyces libani subsp. libani]GGV91339.1 hypothetical protein GCM10010500_21340 [Streptomyces libani subsp. libani]